MAKDIIGNSYKGIFLHKHLAIFHYDSQTVHIRIHYESHISLALCHKRRYLGKVFWNGFRCMRETAGSLTVQFYNVLYPECTQKLRYYNAADGIYSVYRHSEIRIGNSIAVNKP